MSPGPDGSGAPAGSRGAGPAEPPGEDAGDPTSPRPSAPGSHGGLVFASALLVALALAAGLWPGQYWLVGLLVTAAMVQGLLAGVAWDGFWRGPVREELFGAGGRYAGFLAAVAFSAVEAYAVGAGIGREGAPGPVVAIMLAPPLVVAAVALRSAVRHRRERDEPLPPADRGTAGGRTGAEPDGPAPGNHGPGTKRDSDTATLERSEGRGP